MLGDWDVWVVFLGLLCVGVVLFGPWLFGDGVDRQEVSFVGKGDGYRSGQVVEYEALSSGERASLAAAVEEGSVQVAADGMWRQRGASYLVVREGTVYEFRADPVMAFAEGRYALGMLSLLMAVSFGSLLALRAVQRVPDVVRLDPPKES